MENIEFNDKDKHKKTPLIIAVGESNTKIIKLIKETKNKLLIESKLDFSGILDNKTNIEKCIKRLPNKVVIT